MPVEKNLLKQAQMKLVFHSWFQCSWRCHTHPKGRIHWLLKGLIPSPPIGSGSNAAEDSFNETSILEAFATHLPRALSIVTLDSLDDCLFSDLKANRIHKTHTAFWGSYFDTLTCSHAALFKVLERLCYPFEPGFGTLGSSRQPFQTEQGGWNQWDILVGCFKKTGKDFTTLAKSYDIDAVRSAMFIDLSPFPCFYDASARLIIQQVSTLRLKLERS